MYPYRVFVAYSHEDRELARRVMALLERIGLIPMSDEHLLPGAPFTDQIKRGIAHAHVFLPLITEARAEGNAGNQIKITGEATITNSVLVGNCAFFEGKPFTYNVDPCRALGNTLEVVYTGGEQVSIVNSTFYGQGDGLVGGGPREGFQCSGSETLTGRNNVFLGDQDFFDPTDITFLFYQEDCSDLTFEGDYSIAHNVKNVDAPYVSPPYSSAHNLLQDPLLSGPFSGDDYGMMLASDSPAIDAGDNSECPATDCLGHVRPVDGDGNGSAICDMGAHEFDSSAAP